MLLQGDDNPHLLKDRMVLLQGDDNPHLLQHLWEDGMKPEGGSQGRRRCQQWGTAGSPLEGRVLVQGDNNRRS